MQRPENSRTRRFEVWIRRTLFLSALVAVWQFLSSSGYWDSVLFPAPLAVFRALVHGCGDGTLLGGAWVSLKRLGLGYGMSIAVGVPLGLILGRIRTVDETIGPVILGLQALPSICWLPLAILWFGLGEVGILFVVLMGSSMALAQSVRDGVRAIPPQQIRAARMLGASPRQAYVHVLLPASLPSLLTGARMGWSFAWRSLMAAELLHVDRGLGALLSAGRELHDMPRVASVMLMIMVLGLLTERLGFTSLERLLQERWGQLAPGTGWGV